MVLFGRSNFLANLARLHVITFRKIDLASSNPTLCYRLDVLELTTSPSMTFRLLSRCVDRKYMAAINAIVRKDLR